VATDRRFRTVASALLTRRSYSVTVHAETDDIAELAVRERADVAVIDATGSLTAAARETARLRTLLPHVGVVAVSDDPHDGSSRCRSYRNGARLGPCFAAIEQARGDQELTKPQCTLLNWAPGLRSASWRPASPLPLRLIRSARMRSSPRFLAAVLVVIAAIDIRSLIIPNRIVLPVTGDRARGQHRHVSHRATEFCSPRQSPASCSCFRICRGADWHGGRQARTPARGGSAGALLEHSSSRARAVSGRAFVLVRAVGQARKSGAPVWPSCFGALFVMIVPRLAAWLTFNLIPQPRGV